MARIKAITFDLWDTIVFDDSDEAKRRDRGLRSKRDERRHVVWEALSRHGEIDVGDVTLAYDVCDAACERVWRHEHITWSVADRIDVLLRGLGRTLPQAELDRVVDVLGRMEVDIPPDPIPGVHRALEVLSSRYRLGIVSDVIVTPGRGLRELLDGHGLKRFFGGFAFSDEVGRSKPNRAMFDAAAAQLGVDLTEMVHIGDRDHNDVKGSQALGMKAVLFVAARDSDKDTTTADAICSSYDELPAVIDALVGGDDK